MLRFLPRKLTTEAAILGAVFVIGTTWFFSIEIEAGVPGPIVLSDGRYFWLYLRSLMVDGDVDFQNDYAKFADTRAYPPTSKGHLRNLGSIGPAILWLPFVLPVRGVVLLGSVLGKPWRTDGMSRAEELAGLYGTFLYAFFAILLALRFSGRHLPRAPALVGALGIAIGGPLIYYGLYQPSYSHAQAAFAAAAFIERWDATRERRSARSWVALGALGGLALLVRPELVVLAVLPLSDFAIALRGILRGPAGERRARLGSLGLHAILGAAAALLAFSPQMAAWQYIHGHLIAVPQGLSFMRWGSSLWAESLFHARGGILPWMPLAIPALLGLALVARSERSLGIPLLLVFALSVYVNGAAWDWWGGTSFGGRRYTFFYPAFALGLGITVDRCHAWFLRNPRAFATAALAAVVGAFCLFNLSLMFVFQERKIDWRKHKEFYPVYADAFSYALEKMHDKVGNPLSWPSNLVFAEEYDTKAAAYDEVAADYVLGNRHPIAQVGWLKIDRQVFDLATKKSRPFLDSGFGAAATIDGRRSVLAVKEKACILLPMVRLPKLKLTLTGGGSEMPRKVDLSFNKELLSTRVLGPKEEDWVVTVPADRIRRGINTVCLTHHEAASPPPLPREIGRTGLSAPVDIAVRSAGFHDGNLAEIWVDGRQVGQLRRGLNVAAIDARTGELLSSNYFDLFRWAQTGILLQRWMAALPAGCIVAAAARDDISKHFDDRARAALRWAGAGLDPQGKFRFGYALVGRKGASPGQAIEQLAKGRTVHIVLGQEPEAWRYLARYRQLLVEIAAQDTY